MRLPGDEAWVASSPATTPAQRDGARMTHCAKIASPLVKGPGYRPRATTGAASLAHGANIASPGIKPASGPIRDASRHRVLPCAGGRDHVEFGWSAEEQAHRTRIRSVLARLLPGDWER